MSRNEFIVNEVIAFGIAIGSIVLLKVDKPMTNFLGMMLMAVAILVAGYSFVVHKFAGPDEV